MTTPSNEPVFLLSSERSGSNLIRVMMDSHLRFCAPHSPHLIKTFVPLLSYYGDLRVMAHRAQLARDMVRVVDVQLRAWPYLPEAEDVLEAATEPTFGGLVRAMYGLAAAKDGKLRSFIKDNGAMPHAAETLALFPDARFVYLVRDARDVALSWKRSPGHPGGVREAARMWSAEQRATLYFLGLTQGSDRVFPIRYEALVGDSERTLRGLCEWLGESFEPSMLDFHKGREAKTSADAAIGWKNLTKPVMSENTGKYKGSMTAREHRAIERIAGREMRQLGYEPELVTRFKVREQDLVGKVLRAARTALRQVSRGPDGIRELRTRTQRLSGLREIQARASSALPRWLPGPDADQPDRDTP